MVGERIKLKRQANKMSLSDMVERMAQSDVTISKAALSNYETGKSVPSEAMIRILARELGTTVGFLESEMHTDINIRLNAVDNLLPSDMAELMAYIQIRLEKHIEIDRCLGEYACWQIPEQICLEKYDGDKVEELTARIRATWGLNHYPISSICQMIEDKGWDLYDIPRNFGLTSVSGYEVTSNVPFLYYTVPSGVVNLRMELLEELARFFFVCGNEAEMKKIQRHFAGAFLFTPEQAVKEFGGKRIKIMPDELNNVKQKYGLPKYEIMYRLLYLGIITPGLYYTYLNIIRQRGYPSGRDTMKEPLFFYEVPTMYRQRTLRALAEGLINDEDMAAIEFQTGGYYEKY